MTKRKLRYSELAPVAPPAPEAVSLPEPGSAPEAVSTPEARSAPDPVGMPEPTIAERPRAPLDLARALAAAREAEAGIAPPTPVAPHAVSGRLTPVRPAAVVTRPTPMRGNVAISRLTPVQGPVVIVAHPVTKRDEGATTLRDRARLRAGRADILVFTMGSESFGVELAAVEEAVDLPPVRHIPQMPPAMLGVTTVRGALTPIYSPEAALGIPLRGTGSALVFRRERGRLGIAVDDVDDVHTLDLALLRDTPTSDAADGLILGVLRHGAGLLALLDAEALIAACQSVPALETA